MATTPRDPASKPPPGVPGAITRRALVPADAERLRRLFGRLSQQTVYNRFFVMIHDIPPGAAEELADNDGVNRVAIAAEIGGEIVAVARYAMVAPGVAEVAVLVQDDQQGHHLGPDLLAELADLARAAGITGFKATVLGENTHALHVFRKLFPALVSRFEQGTFELEITL